VTNGDAADTTATAGEYPQKVAVAGATGRTGYLIVQELLQRNNVEVVGLVRNMTKAEEMLPSKFNQLPYNPKLDIQKVDFTNPQQLGQAVQECDAVIWAATGFTNDYDSSSEQESSKPESIVDKVLSVLGFKTTNKEKEAEKTPEEPKQSIDDIGLPALAKAFQDKSTGGTPKIVMVSSAGVTRPSWTDEKKQQLVGCADIPIVRLNPFGILDIKAASEEKLRDTGVDYCIFRPCGLNDEWPMGQRPILSQGDVAVGRINRQDVATLCCDVLGMPEANGKTFEAVTLGGGYAPGGPSAIAKTLSNFPLDSQGPLSKEVVTASYSIMQQLLPGEKQEAAKLAMGQTYEQLDNDETGRFGKRGEEQVDGAVPVPTN